MMKKAKMIGEGAALMLSAGAGLAFQYGHMPPWQHHDNAPQQKQIVHALMNGGSGQAEHDPNGTVTDVLFGIGAFGFLVTSMGIVALIADLPEAPKALNPVDIPLQQYPAAQSITVYETL